MTDKTIFVWREKELGHYTDFERPKDCPCCKTTLKRQGIDAGWNRWRDLSSCPLCGWCFYYWAENQEFGVGDNHFVSTLREFDINSPSVALTELGAHLKHKFADVYDLTWRRFEEIVADVFRAHGFATILTQPTKDGGADILVLNNERENYQAIIECKKYEKDRKLGVSIVRMLVGAAVDWNVQRAYLVTTSDFSRDAKIKALDYKRRGYEMDLMAASDLLTMLKVYNERLPLLAELDEDLRRSIIESNET